MSTKSSTKRQRMALAAKKSNFWTFVWKGRTIGKWIESFLLFGALGPFLAGTFPWVIHGWSRDVELRLMFAGAVVLFALSFAGAMWFRFKRQS